jgi:uncharacterized protein (DUF362 family)
MTSIVGAVRTESISESLRKLQELIGIFSFLKKGQRILIKANINTYHKYPGNTDSQFLAELIKELYRIGVSEVIVGDMSTFLFAKNTRKNMRKLGIEKETLANNAKIIAFNELTKACWITVKYNAAVHWPHGFRIPKIVYEVDHIINLSIVKAHLLAGYTGALKNIIGIISVKDRLKLHSGYRIGTKIAELNLAWKPTINLMDCRKVFVSGGPFGGKLCEPNIVLASPDRIACDIVGLAILKTYGMRFKSSVWHNSQIARARELKLGAQELSGLELKSFGINEIEVIKSNMR